MTYIVDDSRVFDARPVREVARWLVANDKFLSGWGHAPRRSLVAYPADAMSLKRLDELYEWCDERSDFVRVRVQERLPRLRDGDHLSIYDVPSRFTEPEPVPEPWTMFIDMCSGGECVLAANVDQGSLSILFKHRQMWQRQSFATAFA